MFERLSEWMSATSFAMRRVRLDDMAGCNVKMRLLKASLGCRYKVERRDSCRLNKVIVAIRPKAEGCFVL